MKKDMQSDMAVGVALAETAVSANGTSTGNWIDTVDDLSLTFLIHLLARTDGTYTPLIEDANESDKSDAAAVDDQFLTETEANSALSAVGVKAIGYVGHKRYVRLKIVASSVSSGGSIAAQSILQIPRHA